MRMNRYLASTLFTGLFVTASFLSPAMGQEQTLQPQGSWAVSKIDKAAQGGNSYCTLSRKYDDGVVLSLGRNQTEEYSVAIDFQKQVFTKDKSLKINLQPGPGQIRSYDLMPASDKAVVVRLGFDNGFFESLNKSQQMKVKIADKSYAFAMPQIAKGQADLEECMEGLQAAAKSAKGADKTAAASKDVLNADPKASKAFDAAKSGEKLAAAPLPEAAPAAAAAEEPEIKISSNDEDAPKRRNFASKSSADDDARVAAKEEPKEEKIAELPRREKPRMPEPEAQKAETTSAPAAAAQTGEAEPAAKMAAVSPAAAFEKDEAAQKALQKQIADLKAQNEALKQKSATPSADTQKQLAAIEAEKAALQQKLNAAQMDKAKGPKPEDIAEAELRQKELEAKNQQLEESLRQAQVRIGETAINTETKSIRRIAELESKLQAAQNDNSTLAKQLESLRVQSEDHSVTAIAGDWDLEKATKRYNEAEREIRRLGLQLEQERTSCNREKAQIEQMLFDPAVADQKQIQRLSQLESDLKAAQAKVADTQKMVQDQVNQQVAAQVAQKTGTLEQQIKSLQAEKAGVDAQVASLQKSLADREASVAKLQKSAAEAQTAAADKAKLTQQIADMQKVLAAGDAAFAKKEQELAALKAQPKADPAQVSALQAQIKSMSDAIALKDKAVADAQAAATAAAAQPKADPAQITAMQAQIKAMNDALALKDKAVIDAQNAAKAAQAAAATPQAQLVALQAQNKAMNDALAMKDKAIADAQAKSKTDPAVLKQIGDLQTSMTSIKADNDALRDQNIVLRQEADKLRLQLSDATTNGGARADQLASLQLQIDTLKRQAATKDTQIATFQNQLASAQQESSQLKSRLSVADSSRSSNTEEVSALTRQVQQLQKQVTDMQAEKSRRPDQTAMAETYANIMPSAGGYAAPAQVQRVPAIASTALPAAAAMSGYDNGAIQSLLQKSGVSANVTRASSGFAGADNFGWNDGNVKGLASVKVLGGANFDDMVNQYIAYQKGQCPGDFASMPSPSNGGGAKRMAMYEIACVGGTNQSASLLFFEDQGRFIAVANQIDAANMDVAMDSRDKIAGFVRGL